MNWYFYYANGFVLHKINSNIFGINIMMELLFRDMLTALVEISFSSGGRVVAYNARGPRIESHLGHCIFRR